MDAYTAERVERAIELGQIKEWPWKYYKALHDGKAFTVFKADCMEDLAEAVVGVEIFTRDFTYEEITKEEYEALSEDIDMKAYADQLYEETEAAMSEEYTQAAEEEARFYAEWDTKVVKVGMYVQEWDEEEGHWREGLLISVGEKTMAEATDQANALQEASQAIRTYFYCRELTDAEYAEALKTAKKLEV